MNNFKFSKFYLIFGWILILLVVLLSLSPESPKVTGFDQSDKLGHLVAYSTLMLWFANIYHGRKERASLILLFIAMGAVLELLQGLVGYRTFQYADMIFNTAGVFLGWLLARNWFGYFLLKLDGLLSRGN